MVGELTPELRQLTPEQRALVESAAPMARALAANAAGRWPELADDLVSIAHEALARCACSYDPAAGVPFEAYAYARVQGDLRRVAARELLGPSPRLAALYRADERDAAVVIEPGELAEAMADSPEAARARLVAWLRREAASMIAATLLARPSAPAEEQLVACESYRVAHRALEAAVRRLPPAQRHLVERFYRDGATHADIAGELGRSARTIGRLHTRTKARLARELCRAGVTGAPPLVDAPRQPA